MIFARLPVPGKVKTRLAASVGNVAACTFYRAAAENALREAVKCVRDVVAVVLGSWRWGGGRRPLNEWNCQFAKTWGWKY